MRDLNEFEILDRVAARLSLDAASRDLDVSPSTISRKLAALEKRLGVALVQRTTRAVRLTAAGEAFAERCRAVCAAADQADAAVAIFRESFSGELSVNAPPLFGRLVLAPILFAFGKRHPSVRIRACLTNNYIDPVSERADLVIRTGPLSDSSLRARRLATAPMQVVASPQCIDLNGMPSSLAEVAAKPCVVFGTHHTRWRCGAADGLEVNTAFAADDLEVLADAAVAGLGFALLPSFLVADPIREGRLRRVELTEDLGANPVSAVFPGHEIPNRCARTLADEIADWLRKDPRWLPAE